MNIDVDTYIDKHTHFYKMPHMLRQLIISTDLKETIKWRMPTFTYNNKDIMSLGAFKSHHENWIFQGTLLKGQKHILTSQEKTKNIRQWRLTHDSIIDKSLFVAYSNEAISNKKRAIKITYKKD